MLALLLALLLPRPGAALGRCTYETWSWNVVTKKAENRRRVEKPRAELTKEELGPKPGCSVCEEDQAEVRLPDLAPFRVCRALREKVENALRAAAKRGFPLRSVVGYRVGRSKGGFDERGLRTGFSNHSYGTALDVNSALNGLYESCPRFGPACRLRRGGSYRPGDPGVITAQSPLYSELTRAGLRWGGEIQGDQKDFMHFSLTGM